MVEKEFKGESDKKRSSLENIKQLGFEKKYMSKSTLQMNSGSNVETSLHKSMISLRLLLFGSSRFGFPTRDMLTKRVKRSCNKEKTHMSTQCVKVPIKVSFSNMI